MIQIFGPFLLSIFAIAAVANSSGAYCQNNSDTKFTSPFSQRSDLSAETYKPFGTKAARFPKQAASGEGWQIGVAPYLYATGISGTVGARGRTIGINASFGDVWKKLDIPLMVVFEARKRRFFSLTDLVWVKLSDERNTPGDLYASRKVGVNLFVLDPEAGYRLIEHKKGTFDVLGGLSIWSVETNINVTTGRLPGFDASMRKTWASPVIGVRGNYDLNSKFFVSSRFEIGGAGIGADLATKFYGSVGYRLTPAVTLAGGYRLLKVDYDDHNGFLFDTRMNGLVIGTKLSF